MARKERHAGCGGKFMVSGERCTDTYNTDSGENVLITGLGEKVIRRLRELTFPGQRVRRQDSRNLGTTLSTSPVLLFS